MRLIDADALLSGFDVCKVTEYDESGCGVDYKAVPVKAIDNAPTIDAVPVVRCEDCQHWGTGDPIETDYGKICEFAGWMVGANGYCVYGERQDEYD